VSTDRALPEYDGEIDGARLIANFAARSDLCDSDLASLRVAARHYLTPQVAASADMTLLQLRAFVGGVYRPTNAQLKKLANRMRFKP
jgi:hypothetical protein